MSKWYGPVIGLNQVTLELRPGITGLVGHNGAGKSTLLRLAAGLIRPDLGSVRVAGYDAWKAVAKRHLGYCPENDAFYEEWSGRRFVEAMAYLCGYARRDARGRAAEALKLVGMRDDADRPLASYSKGMRQRIKLAQALLHDPELVLLDEPLNGIDPIGRRDMLALFEQLAQRGKCLLISSHELDQIDKLTDHVIIMAAGRIAAVGTLSQIREVLDGHPLTVRIVSDANRRLAADLLALDEVVGVERAGDSLLVRVRQPNRFFAKIADLVLEDNIDIRHLETLDESTRDVLGYLLGEKSR
ncbi:MAG: ABC transporter ATP-binding protein [Gemmataceae bacterium]|nr:ABC transporter ATP-binding protein [Gemmataceae bacterium]